MLLLFLVNKIVIIKVFRVIKWRWWSKLYCHETDDERNNDLQIEVYIERVRGEAGV